MAMLCVKLQQAHILGVKLKCEQKKKKSNKTKNKKLKKKTITQEWLILAKARL